MDENDEILCLAENAQVTRWDNPLLWQSTVRSLRSLTIEEFVNGQPFIGANHYAITTLFMGDPIGISIEGYFQHSQYEGTDYTISDKASKALFEHYRGEYINTLKTLLLSVQTTVGYVIWRYIEALEDNRCTLFARVVTEIQKCSRVWCVRTTMVGFGSSRC